LFQRAIAVNGRLDRVDVINPDPGSSARFAGLLRKKALVWYPSSELFLASDALA